LNQMADSRYQFGPFDANLETGELRRRGLPVKLQEQPFRLLAVLLENAGEIVSKEQVQSRIWPGGTFVDFDSGLRVAVRKLREALGDDADDPRYIETIPRRGYRFMYPAVRLDSRSAEIQEPAVEQVQSEVVVEATTVVQAKVVSRSQPRLLKYGAVSFVLLALAAVGFWLSWPRTTQAGALTDKDVVILADFSNSTGDPVFNDTLRQALAIQLEQSPFLKIMDDEQVDQTLRLMSLTPDTRVTDPIARDVCIRDGAAATIDGSIAGVGKSYVVTLKAAACQSGATLAHEQSQADDKEHVLHALQVAATALRARLGESRSSIEKLNPPLEQVTSSSLEALNTYTAGKDLLSHGKFFEARPLFERALALDPNFAMGYVYLSVACGNAGDTKCEYDNAQKAFMLIDRVTEYERPYIAGGHYELMGELDKAIAAYRVGAITYPRVWGYRNLMSENHITLGQFENGLQEGQIAQQLEPDVEPPYRRLMDAYMNLDQLDEAKKVEEGLRSRNFGGARIHQRFLEIAYAKEDEAAAAREVQWFTGRPEEYVSFGLQAAYRNLHGERREASGLYRQASISALREGLKDAATDFEDSDAVGAALVGKCSAKKNFSRPPLALALCGDIARAEQLLVQTSKQLPNDLIWNAVQLPTIRAAIELHQGHSDKVVEMLASARPYERAYLEVPYIRGLALLRLGRGMEAAIEFRKITEHPGSSWGNTWRHSKWGLYYAPAHLRLAQAFVLAGDLAKATEAYNKFLTLWRDADASIPLWAEAQREHNGRHS
jgi:DNA-binding winged helix-turn-helix (wHTH) protein/tetratricopeptide (TPR) repeat protein